MHNQFFYERPDQRILGWRSYREELVGVVDPLDAVATWAASAPLSSHNIDCWECSNWPTAWELVDEGVYCEFSIALLMEFTLRLTFPDRFELKLLLIENKKEETLKLCLLVNDEYLLNYNEGQVVGKDRICDSTIIHSTFVADGNNHKNLH